MDFFDAQDEARRVSRLLIVLFLGAVVGMIAIVYVTVLVVMGLTPLGAGAGLPPTAAEPGWFAFHPGILGAVTLGMGALIGGGTAFRTSQLSRGGGAVAELLGGRRVDPATQDPGERVLLNVVEEMSIASGLPVPGVFVMDGEQAINAFAAGHTSTDAAVAVTRGALDLLTRDELQGVVAHEFSHILNGDMRLNVRLMGLLFGILLLSVVGRGVLRGGMLGGGRRGSGGRRGGGGQVAVIGVVLILLGYLGVVFGRLIQAAVSRQREFLADAAAVEFTRNPGGLAGALKRIGGAGGSRIQNHHAEEAGHLFFAGGTGRALLRLTSTHPPLEERVRRLDPRWDGSFELPPSAGVAGPGGIPTGAGRVGGGGSDARRPGIEGRGGPMAGTIRGFPATLLASAGAPQPRHVDYARRLLAEVPPPLREAVRTPGGAVPAVLALLQGGTVDPWTGAGEQISGALGKETAQRTSELAGAVRNLDPAARLPLLELALPSLRTLPRDRANALRSTVRTLIGHRGDVRPFDFALFHLLQRTLAAGAGESPARRPGSTPLARLRGEAELLLSAVVRSASGDEAQMTRAFERGAAVLKADAGETVQYRLRPRDDVGLDRVDAALDRMEGAVPAARKAFLTAAATAVQADGRVEVEEAEMLRALAEALDVPLPPLLPDPEPAPPPADPPPTHGGGTRLG